MYVCACARFIANAIRGEWNKQPRLRSRSKCPKGEECGRRINITCKTHKVSRILHQAQTDISKASSNRLFVSRQMFAIVKKKNKKWLSAQQHRPSTPAPRAIVSYLALRLSCSLYGSGELLKCGWPLGQITLAKEILDLSASLWTQKLNFEYLITPTQNMIS